MFLDPQTLTYATVAKVLPKIGSPSDGASEYRLNDGGVVYDLILQHSFAKRNRVTAKLRRDAYADDPLVDATQVLASASVSFTIDYPHVGVLPADAQALAKMLVGWLSDANVLKLVNGET